MARGKLIGLMTCPTCAFPDMEVREDKNGNPYAFCPDCTQQMLTHGGRRGELMQAKMRPLPGEPAPAEAEPEPPEAAEPAPAEATASPDTVTEGKKPKSTRKTLMG